jgi:hypothetical protein
MVDSHEYLVQIVENAFNFEDKSKSVPLALKFSSTVIDFGFYEEYRNKFIELFINICLDKNKMKDINLIPRSKIYLYYIIYLIFKDSWENVHIEQNKLKNFIQEILCNININDNEVTQIIIKLINSICDSIFYPKLLNNEIIDIEICSIINISLFKLIIEIIKSLGESEKVKIVKSENINFIIKQSFNAIIKIISGINLVNCNNTKIQQELVNKENKQTFYEFIIFFSKLNLDEKNFCWLLDIMAKLAEISYYSDIFLKEQIINIIFENFIHKKNFISEVFQFMRSLLEVEQLFRYYSACDKFYNAIGSLDVDKNPNLVKIHFLFIIQQLLEKGAQYNCLDSIYDRLCVIQVKEKVEQIFYKNGNEEIIHTKYNEIINKLDELSKKILVE